MSPPAPLSSQSTAFPWYDPRRAGVRLVAGLVVGVLVALVVGPKSDAWVAVLLGWDAGSIVMLATDWAIIARADANDTRRRAANEDPGRTAVWLIVTLASAFSVVAAAGVLQHARAPLIESRGVLALLGLGSVACSWMLTHSSFTLRYAHLYYRDDAEGVGGLTFPGERPPDEFDFAYFAFTIGMCFQVSDVTVTGRALRRTVLFHSLISFAFNTAILALALNAAFGELSGGR